MIPLSIYGFINSFKCALNLNIFFISREMKGTEYCLLYAHEPILYVIRKQYRTSPKETSFLEDFFILSGTVYKCPSLESLVHSKLRNLSHLLSMCVSECNSCLFFVELFVIDCREDSLFYFSPTFKKKYVN